MMFTLCAVCAFGTESVLKKEISRLGYEILSSENGSVKIKGSITDTYNLNLHLRTATRVLLEVAEFKAESFDELFDGIYAADWQYFLPVNAKFNVEKITTVRSKLFSKSDCQRIIKKACAEKMKKAYKTSTLTESGANYPIFVNLKNNIVSVYLNTSGDGLHKRGYRLNKGNAPLTETLAASIVLLSGYIGQCEMADFMCGSGTIPIEAAMIASDTPAGINRSFLLENWENAPLKEFALIKEKALAGIKAPEHRILASDISYSQIKNAEANAQRAGVADFIAFQKMDMNEFSSSKFGGTIICNPPYGERLGEKKASEELYAQMRRVFDRLHSWQLHVICANPEFQRCFGKKADKNRKLYNGNMLSYLYSYYPEKNKKESESNE